MAAEGAVVCDEPTLSCEPAINAMIHAGTTIRSKRNSTIIVGRGTKTSKHNFSGYLTGFKHNAAASGLGKPYISIQLVYGSIAGDVQDNVVQIHFGGGNCVVVKGFYSVVSTLYVAGFRLDQGEAWCLNASGETIRLDGVKLNIATWDPRN